MSEYASFLLRIWNRETGGVILWRATLESTATHRIYSFSSPGSLISFLAACGEEKEDSAEVNEQPGHCPTAAGHPAGTDP